MRRNHYLGKKVVPFALAMAVAATAMPIYAAPYQIVKASESGQASFGSEKTTLKEGMYSVPVSMKKATDITAGSMAGGCIDGLAQLSVDKDGTASLEINLKSLNFGGITGNAANIQVFEGNAAEGNTTKATIAGGDENFPTKISFVIPKAQISSDGVYISMDIMSNSKFMMSQTAYLAIDYKNAKSLGESSSEVKENVVHIDQFGGYDVKTKVTVEDGKVKDLKVEGSKFEGAYKDVNENRYLPEAVEWIKSQVKGLSIKNQDAFDQIDVVSGATTTAKAIKNSVMTSLGLKVNEEIIPDAPTQKLEQGTYTIQMKNTTDMVEHSLSGGTGEKKVTATLYVDKDGKMNLSYPLISNTKEEPLSVLNFNGYYGSDNTLTKDGLKVVKEDDIVNQVIMPLSGDVAKQKYKTNVYLYVPSMADLNEEMSGITFDHGKFSVDSTVTLYWDTVNRIGELNNQYLSDGIYKVDAKMLKTNGKDESMANDAIVHKAKLTVKDGKYYVTLNFKALNIPLSGQTFHGYLNKIQYLEDGVAKDVTVDQVQKNTNGEVVKDDLGTNYPDLVTFPITEEAMETGVIPMQVFVPMMDSIMPGIGTQKMNLSLDLASLVKTTADDNDFNNGDVIEEAAKKEENKKPEQTPSKPTTPATEPTTTAQKQTQITQTVKLATVSRVKVKNSSKKTATISWKKVKGATGYVVYRSTKKNGKYKAIKTITKGSTTKYKNKKLKKKKTYYYKVRAVKKSGNKKIYSAYSKTVSVKIKK